MKNIFGLILFLIPYILSADQYLCVADSSIGYSFQSSSKKWIASGFNVEDKKYVISESSEEGYEYQVTKLGDQYRVSFCKIGFNDPGFLFCSIPMMDVSFKFNKNNGRYILSYIKGYYNVVAGFVTDSDDDSDTPYIEIGKCSSF